MRFGNIKNAISLLGVAILMISSCAKDNLNELIHGAGDIKTEKRELYPFSNIIVWDNINLHISQDSNYIALIEAGENLLNNIRTRIEQNTLVISNENTAKWLKYPGEQINVYLSIKTLDTLNIFTSGNVNNTDTINGDKVYVLIKESSGTIELTFNVFRLKVDNTTGTADVCISGKGQDGIFYSAAYGPLDCLGYKSNYTCIQNNSTNNCCVNSEIFLDVIIKKIGNVFYKGNPINVIQNNTGEGNLIKLD